MGISRIYNNTTIVIGTLAGLVSIGLWTTGIVPYAFNVPYAVFVAVLLSAWMWPRRARPSAMEHVLLLYISSGIALIGAEFVLRSPLGPEFFRKESAVGTSRYPRMPLVSRYQENVLYQGTIFGNLAAMSGIKAYRELRPFVFKTDAFGFRNDIRAAQRQWDAIILGDSLAVGAETTQETTWANILNDKYGLNVYNLAIQGTGPWHSYINLMMEFDRLALRPGCTVVEAIFTGNDLEDDYYAASTLSELPWNSDLDRFRTHLNAFRNRSVIRRFGWQMASESRAQAKKVEVRKFINGKTILFYRPHMEIRHFTERDILLQRNFAPMKIVLLHLRDFCRSKSLKLTVILIPTKEDVYGWLLDGLPPWSTVSSPLAFSRLIGEFCHDNEIPFIDLKPFMEQEAKRIYEDSGSLLYWYDDTHWNGAGMDLAAKVVYEQVVRKKL